MSVIKTISDDLPVSKKMTSAKRRHLENFRPVLDEWVTLHRDYCDSMKDEASFCFGEQSHTSILAGAAWRAGHIAMTEYGKTKKGTDDKFYEGRCDLYVQSRKWIQNKCFAFEIEAKYESVSLNLKRSWGEVFENLDKAARVEAEKSKDNCSAASVCFLGFYICERDLPHYAKLRLKFEKDFKAFKPHCGAWVFLEQPFIGFIDGYFHAGTAMFINVI